MKRLMLCAALLCVVSAAQAGSDACTCSYDGGDVFEGQTACIRTANGPILARCERVLNNTSWKFLGEPCPDAQLAPSSRPLIGAFAANTYLAAAVCS